MTVTEDRTKEFMKLIASFKHDKVLVGVPASDSSRQEEGINNATLLFINNFGSPGQNIPPRPVMDIGIFNAQDAIAEEYKKAIDKWTSLNLAQLHGYYERVGIIASNSVKRAINEQIGIEPPAASTLANRRSKGFKGTKALLVTGQLRNSITYVIQNGLR